MSRGAQWALFGLSVPGGFALYILLMVVTGKQDELVIYRLSPIWAGWSVFGLTGLACLWATSPKRLTALGRVVPSFPLPSLILILPILLIPPIRRSTRLVRTAAVNAVIWAALLGVALVARSVWQEDQIENHRAESEVASAFHATDVSGPVLDRRARCQAATATRDRVHREHPEAYVASYRLSPLCDEELLPVEAELVAAAGAPLVSREAACRAALAHMTRVLEGKPGVYMAAGDCTPYR